MSLSLETVLAILGLVVSVAPIMGLVVDRMWRQRGSHPSSTSVSAGHKAIENVDEQTSRYATTDQLRQYGVVAETASDGKVDDHMCGPTTTAGEQGLVTEAR
ncbi:hypothetical protein LTS08_008934 [Lithohypha guttulata]|nr:hypothetical protein LTS08_008934 [Lithohypha guttulata]KAK5308752.1 hypothetical protein LTR70_010820 [Exophiala xenobiotica]